MSITQKFLSMDRYFKESDGPKIILNHLNYFSIDDINTVNTTLKTIYNNNETISTKPSCDCGHIVGQYMVGKICPECSTACAAPHEKVKPLLWLKILDPNYRFMNPAYWLMISRLFHKTIDYLRYLCDTKYNPPLDVPDVVKSILTNVLNDVRDYSNTMKHIPNILIYLLNNSKYKDKDKQQQLTMLLDIYSKYQDDIYSDHLPIINKKLFVVENTTKGKFINLASSDIIDVVMTWLKVCSEGTITEKRLSNTMGSVLSNISNLYQTYFKEYIVSKTGMFRKHVYGARSHFTFRNVIVSVPGKHEHDALIVPWVVGLTAFRPHILNKLLKRGYTFKKANNLIYNSIKVYNQEISDILDELIQDAPGGKIRVLSHRNPKMMGHMLEIA